jgi:hypothetical protein
MNSQQGVYMDTDAVRGIAKRFDVISDILKTVVKTLEALLMILKTTAFMGMVGGFAVSSYIERIKPQIEQMADKCAELCKDLNVSVDAYIRGDEEGATRFY